MARPSRARRLRAGTAAALICLGGAAAEAPAAAAAPTAIHFESLSYGFARLQRIANGWGTYYAPDGQSPEQATDEIIVNYMDAMDSQGQPITARVMAAAEINGTRARGATLVAPFAVPDRAHPGKLTYYVTLYYVYPQDGNGDIWISKIGQTDQQVFSVLYKHRVAGSDAAAITAGIRQWLAHNLQTYGTALGTLPIPAMPAAALAPH